MTLRILISVWFWLCSIFCVLTATSTHAFDGVASSQTLIAQANQQSLASHPEWRRLLYYMDDYKVTGSGKQNTFTLVKKATKSKVTQPSFFLSENGRYDPEAELDALITGLMSPSKNHDESAVCRFPARTHWVINQLKVNPETLPKASCTKFDEWFAGINPHRTTLVFASDYLNNPSSMFGHTLLRVDTPSKQKDLLSYGISYAAETDTGSGLAFAVKGLTGGYPGAFSIMPYYEKVKDYGDLESRDLWEYELNLTSEQTKQLVRHTWEMRKITFDYYFISDNCAYALLGLIDVAVPNSHTQAFFTGETIPAQTIRTLERRTDLLTKTTYRPALDTQLRAQEQIHGKSLAKTALSLATHVNEPIDELTAGFNSSDQAKLLEMAYDKLYLDHLKRKKDQPQQKKRLRELLIKRSQNPEPAKRPEVVTTVSNPTLGHDSQRLLLGVGYLLDEGYIELGYKGAYQDVVDMPLGYGQGMAINAVDIAIRASKEHIWLDHFTVLDIESYAPVSVFHKPKSWGVSAGIKQLDDTKQPAPVAYLDYQLGYALSIGNTVVEHDLPTPATRQQGSQSVVFDSFANYCYGQIKASTQFGNELSDGWRIAAGPKLGCLAHVTDNARVRFDVEAPYWFNGKSDTETNIAERYQQGVVPRVELTGQYDLANQQALRVAAAYSYLETAPASTHHKKSDTQVSLSWLSHF